MGHAKHISAIGEKQLKKLLTRYQPVTQIVAHLTQNNARAFLVGGAARDLLMGLEPKDIDIEIHGIDLNELEATLRNYGPVSLVGKSFGVLRLHSIDVDWSIPRTDSAGRKPQVELDAHMSIQDAFRRRDLTINALGIDLNTYELIDPFDGLSDIKNKRLRAPDAHLFVQDPLRFYRVMQFIGRFEFTPDEELNRVCSTMDLHNVSPERIETEFEKLFLKSRRPSLGIEWLRTVSRQKEILPELHALIGVAQDPQLHPEGDAYVHTLMALDVAAHIAYADEYEKLTLMWAALCHDLGKLTTSELVDGRIRSLGHAQASIEPTQKLMSRITNKKELIDAVCKLVAHHMDPVQFVVNNAQPAAYKRLARKLAPQTNLIMLTKLAQADQLDNRHHIEQFEAQARALEIAQEAEKPVLQGRDLLDVVTPGPELGKLLEIAYEIQISQGIKDLAELKRRVLDIHKKAQ